MCVYCEMLPKIEKPTNGLSRVALGIINRQTKKVLSAKQKDYYDALAEAFSSGIEKGRLPESRGSVDEFTAQPRHLAVVCITLEQFSFLESVANEFFDGHMGHAIGWVIASGAETEHPPEDKLTHETVVDATVVAPNPFPVMAVTKHVKPITPVRKIKEKVFREARVSPIDTIPIPDREQLRRMREFLGLSQKEVSIKTGIHRSTIAEMERGRDKRASYAIRYRIHEGLLSLTPAQAEH